MSTPTAPPNPAPATPSPPTCAAPCSPPPTHPSARTFRCNPPTFAATPSTTTADPSHPYVRSGQVALRSILGIGDERGAVFQGRLLAAGGSSSPSSHPPRSHPMLIHSPRSSLALDETLVAALLHAVIGDCAGEFLVAKCDTATFRFHVSSTTARDLLLLEEPVCIRSCLSVFLPYIPLRPSSPPATSGCSSLDDLLRIPYDLSLQFEAIASLHLGSPITLSTDSGHGCHMRA